MVYDDRLIELDFGVAEGLDVRGEPPSAAWNSTSTAETARSLQAASPGVTSSRAPARALNEALASSERLAVVTHGGVFRSALVSVLDLPFEAIWAFHIRNAAIAAITLGEWGTSAQWARLEEFRVA